MSVSVSVRKKTSLISKCFNGASPQYDFFLKTIKESKALIFEPNEVPNTNKVVGPIHALCLQLLANGIIDLKIADDAKI